VDTIRRASSGLPAWRKNDMPIPDATVCG